MVDNIHILGQVGHFEINGEIGSYEDEQGKQVKNVDLMDVVAAVKDLRSQGATTFEIIVNGPGGFTNVGFDIYDFLTTIPEQVKTIALNMCASIDTVIWFAGSEREARCPLMIHNPWLQGVNGDADELQEASDVARASEDKVISFYAKHTNLEKIALDALMKNETYIYPDMAYKLGFSTIPPTEIIKTPVAYRAVAKITDRMSKENKTLLSKMDAVINILLGKKPETKSLTVVEQGGKTLEIKNADGSELTGKPVVGSMVTVEGAPAEGDYVLTDMAMTITVASGVITSVVESALDASKELEKALAAIEVLKKENEDSKALLEESKKDVEAMTSKFSEIEKTLSAMQGKPVVIPEPKSTFRKDDEGKDTRPLAIRMAEYKAKQLENKKK